MDNNKIAIQPFNGRGTNQIIDFIVNIQQNEFNIPITVSDQPDLADIPAFYQKHHGNFWVARHQNRVVGTIALLDIGDRAGALRKMFVNARFRGKNSDIARQLLQTLVFWAKNHDIQNIYLGTTPKFMAAHRFYEKNGFLEIKKTDLPDTFPVMKVDTKFYQFDLQENKICIR